MKKLDTCIVTLDFYIHMWACHWTIIDDLYWFCSCFVCH